KPVARRASRPWPSSTSESSRHCSLDDGNAPRLRIPSLDQRLWWRGVGEVIGPSCGDIALVALAAATAQYNVAPFEVEGPSVVSVTVGAKGRKARPLEIVILRDGRYESRTRVRLTPKRKTPPGFALQAQLAFSVPAGRHTFTVTSASAEPLFVSTQ